MPLYQHFIDEMKSGRRLQKNGRLIRKSTIKNYIALQKYLELYEKEKDTVLRIKDLDYLRTTRVGIAERNYWKRFYFSFTEYLFNTMYTKCFTMYTKCFTVNTKCFTMYTKCFTVNTKYFTMHTKCFTINVKSFNKLKISFKSI